MSLRGTSLTNVVITSAARTAIGSYGKSLAGVAPSDLGAMADPFHDIKTGVTAENLAERMGISREEQDEFAVESHRRASVAQREGKFDDEVVAVGVKVKREVVDFLKDEHIRHEADQAGMAKLPTIFKQDGGTVTAGNASG